MTQHPLAGDALVDIRGLHYARDEQVIFAGVDLVIPRGQITAIMGPSGTGKTTLLRLIGGQLKPDRGSICIAGEDVSRFSRKQWFALRARMGVLFQSGALFTDLSVFDNVAFPLRVHTNLPDDMIRDLVLLKLEAVGLRGASAKMPAQLSGGMARRVALARAIALDPDLVMYDEPFTGQDPIAMGVLLALIRRLNRALGHTSVIVSHDVQETAGIADLVYVLAEGRVLAKGSPAEVFASPDARVQQFLRGLPDGPAPFHVPAESLERALGVATTGRQAG